MAQKLVHFSVEGEFLTELARDLFVEDTPKKAVHFLTESLIGMPENLACDIVTGKKRLVGTNDVLLEDDPMGDIRKNGKFPEKYGIPLTFESALSRVSKKYFEELAMLQMLQRRIMHYGRIDTAYGALYRSEDGFEDDVMYESVSLLEDRKKYKKHKEKFNEYMVELTFITSRLGKTLADLPMDKFKSLPDFIKLRGESIDINSDISFDMLLDADPKTLVFKDDARKIRLNEVTEKVATVNVQPTEKVVATYGSKSLLDNFLESQREIDNKLKEPIKPNPITDKNSAGWLSPNGDWYGLDGEIANMLHNQIADALYEAGIIPKSEENENNPDGWLAKKGWMRIHGLNVQFEGFENSITNRGRNIGVSDAQQKALVTYAKLQDRMVLRFGIRGMAGDYDCIKSAAFIEMCNDEMFEKLFSF